MLLARSNQRDLEDIPAYARAQITFVWMDEVDDAIAMALSPVAAVTEAALT